MIQETNQAIALLFIGMITVFVILGLVILTGNLVIRAVNKWGKDPLKSTKVKPLVNRQQKSVLSPKVIAAISAAVFNLTEGRARIEKIEKV